MSEPARTFREITMPSDRAGNVIAHEIRRAILEGRLQPGDTLREEQLARELGTSRTPVREALIELRNEGLVEARATQRAVVRAYTVGELREIYGLRATLEAHAAAKAAARREPATARALAASLDRFRVLAEEPGDEVAELISENLVFHGLIADAAGVPHLRRMIDQVMVIPRRYRAYAAYVPERRATIGRHHEAVAAAIAGGDSGAAGAAMGEHVRWTGEMAVRDQRRR